MAESVIVEIYELEAYSSSTWVMNAKLPWTNTDGQTPACAPDDLPLPGTEWTWASNWRIDKKPGSTDADGWEYA
jgi:hypothetical protein